MIETIAIAGVGLIGGSMALALRKAGFAGRILGISSPQTIEKALRAGAIDRSATLEEAAAEADVLYLAQPIRVILSTLEQLGGMLDRDILVTDAGSTKAAICEHARRHLKRGQFLGGHPMAGKEVTGFDAADADLFVGRPYVITPFHTSDLDTPLAGAFVKWISRVNAVAMVLGPAEHDRIVACTSHLPQVLSTALALQVGETCLSNNDYFPYGPGLEDMTRLALSSYSIWADILATNSAEICHAIDVYIDNLTKFRENLATSGIAREFDYAAEVAARVRRRK